MTRLCFCSSRKRPQSPPPKSSGKGLTASAGKSTAPAPGSGKPSSTLSRREELLKQLKAVEDAIARKRAKIPGKWGMSQNLQHLAFKQSVAEDTERRLEVDKKKSHCV